MLNISHITMAFGSLIANDDVSFEIETGTITGLIGPNGAGKTTLFNCITGMCRPTQGQVFFNGKDITGLPPHQISRLGAVRTFQVVHPLKEMSVLDNVMVGAFMQTASTAKAMDIAREAVSLCHLDPFAHRLAGEMTIGTKKRLEVARILATGAKLLMLDEAMAGLTSTEVNEAVGLITRLREKGYTLLVVEHIMEAIMPVADKVVVLDNGRKIAEGMPKDVISDPQVIAAYLGPKFSEKIQQAPGAAGPAL